MSKATLIAICDVSASMGKGKKSMANEYFGFVKSTLESKYNEVDEKFIAHTTTATEVCSKQELFSLENNGGTYISTGLEKAIEIARKVNNYESDLIVIQFSDGDNWGNDNDKTVKLMKKLVSMADFTQFVEIRISDYSSTIGTRLKEVNSPRFRQTHIKSSKGIITEFSEVREIVSFLESKHKKIVMRDNERKYDNNDIESINRKGRTTVVTLIDGVVGVSTCSYGDEYDEEIGFNVAYLRAKIKSSKTKLDRIINPVTIVEVVNSYKQCEKCSKLANKYVNDDLWFDYGYVISNGEKLELIEYTKHIYDSSVAIAVCKDKENRIILIESKGIEEVK